MLIRTKIKILDIQTLVQISGLRKPGETLKPSCTDFQEVHPPPDFFNILNSFRLKAEEPGTYWH